MSVINLHIGLHLELLSELLQFDFQLYLIPVSFRRCFVVVLGRAEDLIPHVNNLFFKFADGLGLDYLIQLFMPLVT